MIETIALLIIALLTGIAVKYADIIEDNENKKRKAEIKKTNRLKNKLELIKIFLGLIYGILLFSAIAINESILPLWVGIVIGLIIIGKIDGLSHYVGVSTFFALLFLRGYSKFNAILLIIFIAVCVLEEIVNDYFDKHKIKNKKLRKFVAARPLLEITALIASIVTGNWLLWFALLFVDIGYVGTANLAK